jgi:predicted Zn-dependent protease
MKYPANGLVTLLEFFQTEMLGYQGQVDEYLLSHPVSKKRIDLIKARTKNVNFSDKKINKDHLIDKYAHRFNLNIENSIKFIIDDSKINEKLQRYTQLQDLYLNPEAQKKTISQIQEQYKKVYGEI